MRIRFESYILPPDLRRFFKPAKPVRHQQTCPVCGRKLVNTYFRNGEWKCRRCWEEDGICFTTMR